MESAYEGSTFIPVEGYEWIEAIAPKKEGGHIEDLIRGKPQPCLVAKPGNLYRIVELLDPYKKGQKLAYEEFYNLYKHLYEKEKLMEAILNFANHYGSIVELETFLMLPEGKKGKPVPILTGVPFEYWEDEIYNFGIILLSMRLFTLNQTIDY